MMMKSYQRVVVSIGRLEAWKHQRRRQRRQRSNVIVVNNNNNNSGGGKGDLARLCTHLKKQSTKIVAKI